MEDQFRSLSELAGVMADSRTIGFVGAGASKRSGYPLWHELLANLRWVLEQETGGKAALKDLPTPQQVDDPRFLAEGGDDATSTSTPKFKPFEEVKAELTEEISNQRKVEAAKARADQESLP